jgi:hypothetical protein
MPLAAEELLHMDPADVNAQSPSAVAIAALAPNRAAARLAEGLVAIMDEFFAAWFRSGRVSYTSNSSSSKRSRALAAPTDWMHPSFLQLVDKLLQKQLLFANPGAIMHALMAGASIGAGNPLVHPRLAAAAGLKPDPALAEQVATAVQEVGAGQQRLARFILSRVRAGVVFCIQFHTCPLLFKPLKRQFMHGCLALCCCHALCMLTASGGSNTAYVWTRRTH